MASHDPEGGSSSALGKHRHSPPTSAPNSSSSSLIGSGDGGGSRRKEKKPRGLPRSKCNFPSCNHDVCGPPGATGCAKPGHGGGWSFTCCVCGIAHNNKPTIKQVSVGARVMLWVAAGELPTNLGLDYAAQCETCYKKTSTKKRHQQFEALVLAAPNFLPMNKDGQPNEYNPAGAPFKLPSGVQRLVLVDRLDKMLSAGQISDEELSLKLWMLTPPADGSWAMAPAGECAAALIGHSPTPPPPTRLVCAPLTSVRPSAGPTPTAIGQDVLVSGVDNTTDGAGGMYKLLSCQSSDGTVTVETTAGPVTTSMHRLARGRTPAQILAEEQARLSMGAEEPGGLGSAPDSSNRVLELEQQLASLHAQAEASSVAMRVATERVNDLTEGLKGMKLALATRQREKEEAEEVRELSVATVCFLFPCQHAYGARAHAVCPRSPPPFLSPLPCVRRCRPTKKPWTKWKSSRSKRRISGKRAARRSRSHSRRRPRAAVRRGRPRTTPRA